MDLFTIGYEGINQEQFLAWLNSYNINVVADVRNLPLSRKKGFSKIPLSNLLKQNNIEYINYRNLGAPKELRSFLIETRDYETFFQKYRKVLTKNMNDVEGILAQVNKGKIVVLLCYESDPETCHRKIVANEVKKKDGNGLKIKHLRVY